MTGKEKVTTHAKASWPKSNVIALGGKTQSSSLDSLIPIHVVFGGEIFASGFTWREAMVCEGIGVKQG